MEPLCRLTQTTGSRAAALQKLDIWKRSSVSVKGKSRLLIKDEYLSTWCPRLGIRGISGLEAFSGFLCDFKNAFHLTFLCIYNDIYITILFSLGINLGFNRSLQLKDCIWLVLAIFRTQPGWDGLCSGLPLLQDDAPHLGRWSRTGVRPRWCSGTAGICKHENTI